MISFFNMAIIKNHWVLKSLNYPTRCHNNRLQSLFLCSWEVTVINPCEPFFCRRCQWECHPTPLSNQAPHPDGQLTLKEQRTYVDLTPHQYHKPGNIDCYSRPFLKIVDSYFTTNVVLIIIYINMGYNLIVIKKFICLIQKLKLFFTKVCKKRSITRMDACSYNQLLFVRKESLHEWILNLLSTTTFWCHLAWSSRFPLAMFISLDF